MTNARILIIDDEESIRKILSEYLERLGYQVITAADGLEGLDCIKQENYDLIIIDIRLPYVSGIGLIKVARDINPKVPIISITGFGKYSESTAKEEATIVLSKPFQLEKLSQTVTQLLATP